MAKLVNTIEYFDDRFYKLKLSSKERQLLKKYHKKKFEEIIYLPSVTTMLGIIDMPFINRWRGDVGNERADYLVRAGGDRGNRVHHGVNIAMVYNKRGLGNKLKHDDYAQEEWVQLVKFKKWYEELKPEVLKLEYIVYSLRHLFAGRMDLLVRLKEGTYNTGFSTPVKIPAGIYLGDVKSGKGIHGSHYQTAAYTVAVEEMVALIEKLTKIKIEGTFTLHLNAGTKRGWKMIVRDREQMKDDFQTALHAFCVWKKENANLTPRVFEMPQTIQLKKFKGGRIWRGKK
jgi:hypothetical protein